MGPNDAISAAYYDAQENWLPYAGGIEISPGQLLFIDNGTAKPPLNATTAGGFAAQFAGVASEAKPADAPAGRVRVSSGRVYRVRCVAGTYSVGDLVEIAPGTPLDSFKVREATANANAIGTVYQVNFVEGNLSPVTSLEVIFHARIWGLVPFLRGWFGPIP